MIHIGLLHSSIFMVIVITLIVSLNNMAVRPITLGCGGEGSKYSDIDTPTMYLYLQEDYNSFSCSELSSYCLFGAIIVKTHLR